MVPSLCSAQLIILHENWHGLGASKLPSVTSSRQKRRAVAIQQDRQFSRVSQTASGAAERGHSPVRVAEHHFHSSKRVSSSEHSHVAAAVDMTMTPTLGYDVIESPLGRPHRDDTRHISSKSHPPATFREGPRTERAVIPNTIQTPVWKIPFSYGYFGTSGTKHWYWHHGYRDRRTEWSYR